jgi:hypothetical protein
MAKTKNLTYQEAIEEIIRLRLEIAQIKESYDLKELHEMLDNDPANQAKAEAFGAIGRVETGNLKADNEEFMQNLEKNDAGIQYRQDIDRILAGDFEEDTRPKKEKPIEIYI